MAKKKAAHKRAAAKSRKRPSTSELTPEASIAPGELTPSAKSSKATPTAAAAASSQTASRSRRTSAHSSGPSKSNVTPADPVAKSDARRPTSNPTPMATTPQPDARPAPKRKRVMSEAAYELHKERVNERNQEQSKKSRDIGPLPEIVDQARRESCRLDLLRFLQTYFPDLFNLEFGDDHIELIKAIEHNILHSGLDAFALPRGSGKTTICECAAIWAVIYGHRRYLAFIGATQESATESLKTIKEEFEENELLLEDFPEVCYPIVCLESIVNRCKGQLLDGKRTKIVWKEDVIVLPTVEGGVASSSVIRSKGITSRIRGMKHRVSGQGSIRPDFVLLDDPQTEESADSPRQNKTRLNVLTRAILHLAGPGKSISGLMPCTVLQPNDMADTILDRNKHPEWHGRRIPGLKSFPTRLDLWEQYKELRDTADRNDDRTHAEARAFYREHRAEMDEGGVTYWPARFDAAAFDSALEEYMVRWLTDPDGFAAEVQQQPVSQDSDDTDLLTVEQITLKQHTQVEDYVPLMADRLTAFIDVGEKLLWYGVVAWSPYFDGYILRYNTWPEQGVLKFSKRKPKKTLVEYYTKGKRKPSVDTATRMGLDHVRDMLLGMSFEGESGLQYGIQRLLVDGGHRDVLVKRFVRESADPRIWVSFGRTPKVGGQKLYEGKSQPGDRKGEHWRSRIDHQAKIIYVSYDTNRWKSKLHQYLATDIQERGSLSLYQREPWKHELLAEHFRAEKRVRVKVNGDEQDVWDDSAPGIENDYFDVFVGNCVAADIEGCVMWSKPKPNPNAKPRKKKRGPIKSRPL